MAEQSEVPSIESLIEQVKQLRSPAAFQAIWDGDGGGWRAVVQVVLTTERGHWASALAVLRFGGNERLFQGTVPPWPEARVARELGDALSAHFGVPFWFPSPQEPDDDCPSWWEQDRAHPCEDCSKLILPRNTPHLPDGVCYPCFLRRERAGGGGERGS